MAVLAFIALLIVLVVLAWPHAPRPNDPAPFVTIEDLDHKRDVI